MKYCLIDQTLYESGPGGMLLRCVDKYEADMIAKNLHGGYYGGYRYWKATSFKILRERYYWSSLFSDVYSQVRACIECQNFSRRKKLLSLPLKPIEVDAPF